MNNRASMRNAVGIAIAVFLLDVPASAFAQKADTARQIVAEAQRRNSSQSQRYEGLLQSFDQTGKTTEKRWIFERLGSFGKSKTIIRFTEPAEVRGVALLIVNHDDRPSDQWMWTPALERDRRVALQDRSTRFFGTDFSFEDLEERDVNKRNYTLLGEESLAGAECWKIQAVARPGNSSQYTRSIEWIRKDNYALAQIDSFVKDELIRRIKYSDIRNVQGIWTAMETAVTDMRRGSITRLVLEKVTYNVSLKESDFTLEAMRRR